MFEKSCPACGKPLSPFSKGMLKGKFACPHCTTALVSKPSIVVLAVAGGIGGGIAVLTGIPFEFAPLAIVPAYPFAMRALRAPSSG